MTAPKLLVVATPIGNPGDFSPRAAQAVREADLILAEDTRRALNLFSKLDIEPPKVISLHEHNEASRIGRVLRELEAGHTVVQVSDAGTPLLSDPGYRLVRACREAGYEVSPIPGPSALTAALSASGLPPYPFTFLGFLPRKDSRVSRLFQAHGGSGATLVFFERKDRLAKTLSLALDVLGQREFCLARELTKQYEQFIHGVLGRDEPDMDAVLGEVTVLIGPGEFADSGEDEIRELWQEESLAGGKPKQVAKRIAARARGWTAKAVYEKIKDWS